MAKEITDLSGDVHAGHDSKDSSKLLKGHSVCNVVLDYSLQAAAAGHSGGTIESIKILEQFAAQVVRVDGVALGNRCCLYIE
jgi:hypothetical protein